MGAPVAHLKLKDLLFCRVHFYVSVSTTGAALARPRGCRRVREGAGQAGSLPLAPLPRGPLSSQGGVGAAPAGGAPGRRGLRQAHCPCASSNTWAGTCSETAMPRDTEVGVLAKIFIDRGSPSRRHDDSADPALAEKPRPGELAAGCFPQDSCTSRSPGQS